MNRITQKRPSGTRDAVETAIGLTKKADRSMTWDAQADELLCQKRIERWSSMAESEQTPPPPALRNR